ncbi:globin family protein [Polymorphum gilvum]|uniref:Putative nitric oxide dioxygenase (NOD) n=1 Tax=Polymorphum gilvum (strain LMG 25793 / CGMCC 1.9160 / SL003B-26A1) TaxID=991905 RepID=F2J1V1_POLGS|nr:globin family protein [Polymorphum gilvum]ADZ72014.1 Putative nitric oxide dioxygenase (NOD) [Polymorphum gilvum SL003B-26A1]
MTPEQIRLVQQNFEALKPAADEAMATFYRRLFVLAPDVRPLFRADIRSQERKLAEALTAVVDMLSSLQLILPDIEALAKRHVAYGVRERHYRAAGEALLFTLEVHLGEDFTPQVRKAWQSAYAVLSDIMIAGAEYRAA